jgi:cytochrome o ubiquinol oxidase subunit 2
MGKAIAPRYVGAMIRTCAPKERLFSAGKALLIAGLAALVAGCDAVVLDPAGNIAAQQRDLLIASVVLMLLIIVPVMVLIVLFAWRYRASNKDATYDPDWDHSTMLELVIWSAPLLIIICLGAMTWLGTHVLDPYRPLAKVEGVQAVDPKAKPLEVDVVALDWKWLFIYPEYGIATVNEMAAPVDRPIRFKITASSVMNSFYVPALAGQIYAMPGMETTLHAVINQPGSYEGFSANYSGAGFSGMRFAFLGLSDGQFDQWIAKARSGGAGALDRDAYLELLQPSENVPVMRFASVQPGLYRAALNLCVRPGRPCMNDVMKKDAHTAGAPMEEAHAGPTAAEVAATAHRPSPAQPIAGAGLVPPAEQSQPAQSAQNAPRGDRESL